MTGNTVIESPFPFKVAPDGGDSLEGKETGTEVKVRGQVTLTTFATNKAFTL